MNKKSLLILMYAGLFLFAGIGIFIGLLSVSQKMDSQYQIADVLYVEANKDIIVPPKCETGNGKNIEAIPFVSPTFVHSGEDKSSKPFGGSIISVKNWIEKKDGNWIPKMEVRTITNKIVYPTGKMQIMVLCPSVIK